MNTTLTNPIILSTESEQNPEPVMRESTYALLVRSEEKSRSLLEMAVYLLCVVSVIAAIWQFVQQPIGLPLSSVPTIVEAKAKPQSCAPVARS